MGPGTLAVKYTRQTMPAAPDPSRCPLCGTPNGCALVAGGEIETCWCAKVAIPAEVLERVPAEARDKSCVCAACARGEPEKARASRPLRTVAH
jgi:hypothetical protein